jgi:C-terminal peptidase prc
LAFEKKLETIMLILDLLCKKWPPGRAAVLAATVAMMVVGGVSAACSAEKPVSAPTATSGNPVTVKTPATAFDGRALYHEAFVHLRDEHYTLVNPAARQAFSLQWEHRHDHDNALTSEKTADTAVLEMMWSLGQRFDYYYPPAQTTAEHEAEDAHVAGIGVAIREGGIARAIKALGGHPTPEQAQSLLHLSDDRPLIVEDDATSDTPAGQAHIVAGDRIVAVDGVSVNGKLMEQVTSSIRGPIGSTVVLTIARRDAGGGFVTSNRTLTRARVTTHAVITDNNGAIAHILVRNFLSQYGSQEMAQALANASQNAHGIILDLRGNPGGSLNQVMQIAQMFIDHGVILKEVWRKSDHMVTVTTSVTHDRLVTTTQSDDGSPPQVQQQDRVPLLIPPHMPVIVLIDDGSASASEILSGTLQANARALVMGEPSRGKGVGQLVHNLPLGRSMHVTNFEFFPGGVKMDWVGIVPDIEAKLPDDVDRFDDPSKDSQLKAAELEMIMEAIGSPSALPTPAQVAARRADLEREHRANFQQEVQDRQEIIARAAAEAAKGTTGTNAAPPPKK